MKYYYLLILLFPIILFAQKSKKPAATFQQELNAYFSDSSKTPLTNEDYLSFEGLPFYKISKKYIVNATLSYPKEKSSFKMKTTTNREPEYFLFAIAKFELNGKKHKLEIYRSNSYHKTHPDACFLPYKDFTNGSETYGGGRFLEFDVEGMPESIYIDFNQSFNPYCYYNHKYSCPIVPEVNSLQIEVRAGVKASNLH